MTDAKGPPSLDILITTAIDALNGDNLMLAEACAQEILVLEPDHGFGCAVMAHIAGLIGREVEAMRWRTKADLTAFDRFPSPSYPKTLELLNSMAIPRHDESFLLIRAWGMGLWSDMFHLLGGLLLAEITGRHPIVVWGPNSLFCPIGTENAFPLYFRGIGNEHVPFLPTLPAEDVFPSKWHGQNVIGKHLERRKPPHHGGEGKLGAIWLLNRPERLVVSDFFFGVYDLLPWIPADSEFYGQTLDVVIRRLTDKYLAPSWRIRDMINEQLENLAGKETIAVHIRGSDKILESSQLGEVNRHYDGIIEQAISKHYAVWLMTDSEDISKTLIKKYGPAIHSLDAMRSSTDVGVHVASDPQDRQRLGEEVVADVLVGVTCDRFVGNGASNPSCFIDFLMEGDETRKHLFLPNQNRHRFLSLYRD